ncbi:hypothetical protein ICW40_09535 [Actinotalea ferrariae]|uniref:hypothetical protein n=1 Tax=Actinotalea ferrariae TaxID=1386098 RepID=UPI001C8B246C|nr:hypothetical protein [Actinotalea ferrariae]MBX9245047.1 hypothetical protein [Actinotalea ferrariae]
MSTPTETAWTDPRDELEVVVLLPNGRLAGRAFASRAEAEAWARPDEGEQVLEINAVCGCDR